MLICVTSLSHAQIDLEFSKGRGFYTDAFDLELTTSNPNASIRYTLDGEEPSPSMGMMYTGNITISTTSIIRAIVFEEGVDTSSVYTHTYLFLEDVVKQAHSIDGWPNNTYSLGGGGQAEHDYEMDPSIVDSPVYSADIIQGLTEIPSLSIVMPFNDFWEVYDGDAEKKTSIELLYADNDSQNEQVDCGIEPHSHFRLKRSMRLSFKKEYGPSKWNSDIFRNAILGGESATDELDRIVLRGGNNRAWSRSWNPNRTAFTRDEWYRQSQLAASGLAAHGTFVHLYVNGLYWGLYNPVERPDEGFTSAYLEGIKDDWFSVSHGGDQGGDDSRFEYLLDNLLTKDLSVSENYEELKDYLDISAFVDYLIVTWMTGVQDWPKNNWWGGISNQPPGQFRYFGWDNEWSWDVTNNANNGAWVHPQFRSNDTGGNNSAFVFNNAKVNEDFMMVFVDRVYKLCFNNGALTDENSRLRWASLNDYIRNAVVAESARWGDSLEDGETRTRDEHWQDEVDRLDELMDGNVERLIDALLDEEYYPTLEPPLFVNETEPITMQEISVPIDYVLDFVNPNDTGDIYYTLDGTDPRLQGGTISPNAILFSSEELTITHAITLQARVKDGDEWSALHCLNLFVQDDLSYIKLTEIMYNPSDFGTSVSRDLEFLEIKNTSIEKDLDISGMKIIDGVEFTFPIGTIISAAEFIVLASNAEALKTKCPDVDVFGDYIGQLDNGGERITFANFQGESILTVNYDDENPWPSGADGEGFSLVPTLIYPVGDQDDATLWKLSQDSICGSPGENEAISTSITSAADQKVLIVYPNPINRSQTFIVKTNEDILSVQLYSRSGLKINTVANFKPNRQVIIEAPKQNGIYFIEIKFSSGEKGYKRITVF